MTHHDDPRVACDLAVFDDAELARHAALVERMRSWTLAVDELPDGYAVRLGWRPESFTAVASWVEGERRCCPFLSFGLHIESGADAFTLELRGPAGTKEALAGAFG